MHNKLQECDTKLNEVPKIIEKQLSEMRSEMNEKLKDQGTSSCSNHQNSSLLTAGIRGDSSREEATPGSFLLNQCNGSRMCVCM